MLPFDEAEVPHFEAAVEQRGPGGGPSKTDTVFQHLLITLGYGREIRPRRLHPVERGKIRRQRLEVPLGSAPVTRSGERANVRVVGRSIACVGGDPEVTGALFPQGVECLRGETAPRGTVAISAAH